MAWWSPTFSVGERLPTNIQLHAAAVDHPRGKLYYSGGTNAEKEWKIFPHVWQFDVENLVVSQQPSLPVVLYGHSSFVHQDKLFVMGGVKDKNEVNGHVFTLDLQEKGASWTWERPKNFPFNGCQYSPSIVQDNSLYCFGGGLFMQWKAADSTDCFNIETCEWTKLQSRGQVPGARCRHSFVKWKENTFVLFGGEEDLNLVRLYSDVYLFDAVSHTWTELKTTGCRPPPTGSHCALIYDDRLFIVGGRTHEWAYLSDIYCLDLRSLEWSKVRLNRTRLLSRFSFTANMYGSQAVLFGGDLTAKHKFKKVFSHDMLFLDMQFVSIVQSYYSHGSSVEVLDDIGDAIGLEGGRPEVSSLLREIEERELSSQGKLSSLSLGQGLLKSDVFFASTDSSASPPLLPPSMPTSPTGDSFRPQSPFSSQLLEVSSGPMGMTSSTVSTRSLQEYRLASPTQLLPDGSERCDGAPSSAVNHHMTVPASRSATRPSAPGRSSVERVDGSPEPDLSWLAEGSTIDVLDGEGSKSIRLPTYSRRACLPFVWAFCGCVAQLKRVLPTDIPVQYSFLNRATLLHWAAAGGHLDCIKCLLDLGANVNAKDAEGGSPLHYAIYCEKMDAAILLLQNGANPNALDQVECSPLTEACLRTNQELLHKLFEFGASIRSSDPRNIEIVHLACFCFKEDDSVIRYLVDSKGGNPDACDLNRFRPIHNASLSGNLPALRFLIEKNVRLDEGDHVNSTPLIFSCFRDQVECTQLLVESGADIHCFEKHGLTALHVASRYGSRCVQYLAPLFSTLNALNGAEFTPLQFAILHRNINSTRILLESGADPETPSQFGSTAILYAAVDDFFEAAQVLIEQHDANANQPDKDGNTALHLVSMFGFEDTARVLLDLHAIPNLRNEKRQLPIHHAASRGQECVLRLLLEKMKRVEIPAEDGIDACDVSGRTALHCCAMTGCLGCVEALLQFGCNVDILDAHLLTPLMEAVRWGHKDVTSKLLQAGAFPHLCSPEGENPCREVFTARHLSAGTISSLRLVLEHSNLLLGEYCGMYKILDAYFKQLVFLGEIAPHSPCSWDLQRLRPRPTDTRWVGQEGDNSSSGGQPSSGVKTGHADAQFDDPTTSDLVFLLSDGRILHAHQGLLVERSQFFGAMLGAQMSEANRQQLEVDDPPEAFELFLRFLYEGQKCLPDSTLRGGCHASHPQVEAPTIPCQGLCEDRGGDWRPDHGQEGFPSMGSAVCRASPQEPEEREEEEEGEEGEDLSFDGDDLSFGDMLELLDRMPPNLDKVDGPTQPRDATFLLQTLEVADRYLQEDLKEYIGWQLVSFLTPENVLELFTFAHEMSVHPLRLSCLQLMLHHLSEFKTQESFQQRAPDILNVVLDLMSDNLPAVLAEEKKIAQSRQGTVPNEPLSGQLTASGRLQGQRQPGRHRLQHLHPFAGPVTTLQTRGIQGVTPGGPAPSHSQGTPQPRGGQGHT